jgi:hypothetical protein
MLKNEFSAHKICIYPKDELYLPKLFGISQSLTKSLSRLVSILRQPLFMLKRLVSSAIKTRQPQKE